MKKVILAIVVLTMMVGCRPSAQEVAYPVVPDGLKDCKFFTLDRGGLNHEIEVTRCPNSNTTTTYPVQEGKNKVFRTAVSIEDE